MEQYIKGFKGFTPVKMCGLSPLASFYFGLWAPKRVNSSYTFDRPETIRDRAKMNLAGHRDRRLSENYFEPCHIKEVTMMTLLL